MDVWEQLKKFESLLNECDGKVKYAGLNAIAHIFNADSLKDTDPNMAIFRAICAEEEAATCLISSLRSQGYPMSEKINTQAHPNKAGVIVFIAGVIDWFKEHLKRDGMPFCEPIFRTTNEPGREAIEIVLPLRNMDKALHPRPPLHLLVKADQSLDEMIGEAVKVKLNKKYIQEIRGAITVKANLRNQLLYATDLSLPLQYGSCEAYIFNQAAIVSALLTAVGLIDPWRAPQYPHSGIVVSAVKEFVRVMNVVKK